MDKSLVISAQRRVVLILLVGLASCAILISPGQSANPERFVYLKELALAVSSVLAVIGSLGSNRLWLDSLDASVATFFGFLALSLFCAADNKPFALRTAAQLSSVITLFVVSRSIQSESMRRVLLIGVSATVITVASIVVLQAYTSHPNYSFPIGMPGGTFGNRNRAAHFLVLGLPSIAFVIWQKGHRWAVLGIAGLVISMSAIVFTRSRGAWLGVLGEIIATAAFVVLVRREASGRYLWRRGAVALGLVAISIGLVITLPNSLSWRSDSPYLGSLRTVADASSPSAQVRLVQYRNTLAMIREHPVLGIGPGNWTLEYGKYTSAGDPAYNNQFLVPTNRLPHSDWLGIAAETGVPALLTLILVAACIIATVARQMRAGSDEGTAVVCSATLAGLITVGFFDPVVLTPASSFLIAIVLGSCAFRPDRAARRGVQKYRPLVIVVVLFVLGEATVLSARQAWAQYSLESDPSIGNLDKATRLDRGDFLSRVRLAQFWLSQRRCDLVLHYAGEAYSLRPTALSAVTLLREYWR